METIFPLNWPKGGGYRFINLTSTDTLEKVMEQAISIFFSIEGRNGEHYCTCTFQLTDQTGEHVQLSQTLQDFQSLKNIYLSKMYFVLQSTLNKHYSFEYLTDSTLNFSTPLICDGDGSLEVSQDSFSLSEDLSEPSRAPLPEDLPGPSRAPMPEDLAGPSRAPLPEDLPGPSRAPIPDDLDGPSRAPMPEVNLPTPDLQDMVDAQPIVINDDQETRHYRNLHKLPSR